MNVLIALVLCLTLHIALCQVKINCTGMGEVKCMHSIRESFTNLLKSNSVYQTVYTYIYNMYIYMYNIHMHKSKQLMHIILNQQDRPILEEDNYFNPVNVTMRLQLLHVDNVDQISGIKLFHLLHSSLFM
jgi:hypothetical protein